MKLIYHFLACIALMLALPACATNFTPEPLTAGELTVEKAKDLETQCVFSVAEINGDLPKEPKSHNVFSHLAHKGSEKVGSLWAVTVDYTGAKYNRYTCISIVSDMPNVESTVLYTAAISANPKTSDREAPNYHRLAANTCEICHQLRPRPAQSKIWSKRHHR